MSNNTGILSNPVQFKSDTLDPVLPESGVASTDPQALWFSIERAQAWAALNILGIHNSLQNFMPAYQEPHLAKDVGTKIAEADEKRESAEKYTDQRDLGSFSGLFGLAGKKKAIVEFTGKSILEIGSGAGKLSDDLRRESKADVIELDFSRSLLESLPPIQKKRGSRLVGDGTKIPLRDGSVDASISMFSTFVHTDDIRSRLFGLTEMLRVTKEGGRLFIAPLLGGMVMRQKRWDILAANRNNADFYDLEMQEYEQQLQQEAAIDYALCGLVKELMTKGMISLTPVLRIEKKNNVDYDSISAIIDLHKPLNEQEAVALVEKYASQF
jgi:ubiquinone/menaquinone biosynthesis C-methylase UbiE